MNPFLLLTLATALSMLIVPLARRLAPRLGMVDMPDPRKVHRVPVARVGGWGIALGSLLPLLLLFRADPLLQSFAIGSATLFLFGLWDDAREIGHWAKFAGQLLAAAVVVYHGNLYVAHFPFIDAALSPAIGKPFTLFALIGTINAVNHSDGLDGLAGGETILSLIAMAFLGYQADSFLAVGIALATIGGILGFLRYNTHPAQVFMGDAGSQVLGFTLGFLVVQLTQVANPALSAALPLLLLGLPLSDILAVLFQRIQGGMNWFKATRNHVHHRLLDLGFDHYETVVIIYSLQAVLVVSAVLLRYQADAVVAATYVGVVVAVFITIAVAERRDWQLRKPGAWRSPLALIVKRLKENSWLRKAPLAVMAGIIPVFMLLSATWVTAVPRDIGVIAALLAAAIAVQILRNRVAGSIPVRAAIYVAVVFCVYLVIHYPGRDYPPGLTTARVLLAVMAVLAMAIGVFIRFASDRKFGTTPTDYLIVFGVLALAMFGNIDIHARDTAQFAVTAIVLFYGCEVLLGRTASRWHPLYLSTFAALAVMTVRCLSAA